MLHAACFSALLLSGPAPIVDLAVRALLLGASLSASTIVSNAHVLAELECSVMDNDAGSGVLAVGALRLSFSTAPTAVSTSHVLAEQDCTAIDYGAGSGVLAVGALRLGASSAVATDVDLCAVAAASRNADLNGVGFRLRSLLCDRSLEVRFNLHVDDAQRAAFCASNQICSLLCDRSLEVECTRRHAVPNPCCSSWNSALQRDWLVDTWLPGQPRQPRFAKPNAITNEYSCIVSGAGGGAAGEDRAAKRDTEFMGNQPFSLEQAPEPLTAAGLPEGGRTSDPVAAPSTYLLQRHIQKATSELVPARAGARAAGGGGAAGGQPRLRRGGRQHPGGAAGGPGAAAGGLRQTGRCAGALWCAGRRTGV